MIARPAAPRRAFVMVEVIISLLILGISLAAILRSFTQSLHAVRLIEVQTQAQFFAMQLMHRMEVDPPDAGSREGKFGEEFPAYSYSIIVEYVSPNYPRDQVSRGIERFFPMRQVELQINYNDGVHKPFVALRMDTAIIGFEKLSSDTKRSYGFF